MPVEEDHEPVRHAGGRRPRVARLGVGQGLEERQGEGGGAGTEVAKQKKATDEPHSSAVEDGQGEEKEKTFAQKIAPLAKKITEYINDHQDDAAQEDRWRTTMQRRMDQGFRELRKEIDGMMNQKLDEKLDKLQEQLVEKIVKAMGK